jgi:hypothetical protein
MHTTVHGSGKWEKEKKRELTGKEMNVMDVMVWNVANAQIPLLSASCEYLFFLLRLFFFFSTFATSCVDELVEVMR